MRNPTSRHLQTPKPLSTFQSDLSDAGHDESALRHALLSPLTFQIISAIMVARSALARSSFEPLLSRVSSLAQSNYLNHFEICLKVSLRYKNEGDDCCCNGIIKVDIIHSRDSKQPIGCFSLRWTQILTDQPYYAYLVLPS